MKQGPIFRITCLGLLMGASACGVLNTNFSHEEVHRPLLEEATAPLKAPSPDAYIREVDVRDEIRTRLLNVDAPSISITDLFRQSLPDIPMWVMDGGVDPHKHVSVNAQGLPFASFLDVVSNLTGDDFVLRETPKPHIEVASVAHRQWSLAAIASARKSMMNYGSTQNGSGGGDLNDGDGITPSTGGGGASSASVSPNQSQIGSTQLTTPSSELSSQIATINSVNNEAGDWNSILVFLKSMLATDGKTPSVQGRPDIPSHIVAIRTLGLVDVTGSPARIREIDRVVNQVSVLSTKQIHLAVNVTEVTLNDDRQEGINWNALAEHIKGNMNITGAINLTNPIVAGVANASTGGINLGFTKGHQSVTSVISLLGQYGKVGNMSRPDVMVLNGKTASINSGLEFSFLQSLQSSINTNSNFQTTSPTFERVLVGVELNVTPRMADGDHIVLDVVPVVSSLQGFDSFTFSGSSFETPRIAINEMTTEVIATSGETILLGGLIFRALSDQIAHLPGDRTALDKIFGATSTELQRHELVITIQPTLVSS